MYRSIFEDGEQYAKCMKGFANYFEDLVLVAFNNEGKLSLIYLLGKVLEVAGKVLQITFQIWERF